MNLELDWNGSNQLTLTRVIERKSKLLHTIIIRQFFLDKANQTPQNIMTNNQKDGHKNSDEKQSSTSKEEDIKELLTEIQNITTMQTQVLNKITEVV